MTTAHTDRDELNPAVNGLIQPANKFNSHILRRATGSRDDDVCRSTVQGRPRRQNGADFFETAVGGQGWASGGGRFIR